MSVGSSPPSQPPPQPNPRSDSLFPLRSLWWKSHLFADPVSRPLNVRNLSCYLT